MKAFNRGVLVAGMAVFGVLNAGPEAHAWQATFATRIRAADVPLQRTGVFHVATNSWSAVTGGLPGADVLYCNQTNDLPLPYAPIAADEAYTDDGGLPSPTSPDVFYFKPGCASQYAISGLEIGYCTDQPSIDVQLDFYDHFDMAIGPVGAAKSVMLPGLPGSAVPGTLNCFTVIVDLRGSAQEFDLLADGDGVYDPSFGDSANDFGMRFRVLNVVGTQTGPLFGGNTLSGGGTRWSSPVVDYEARADGWHNGEYIFVESGAFTGYLHVGWLTGPWLRLFGDACGTLTGEPLCAGDGGGTPCPCANHSPASNIEGCSNTVNGINGGRIEATGTASIGADTLSLLSLRLPATTSVLYVQGSSTSGAGGGSVFGDGLRCASGSVIRLGTKAASLGQARYPELGDASISVRGGIVQPATRYYQAWYRNSAAFCTPSPFNLTNGWRIEWQL